MNKLNINEAAEHFNVSKEAIHNRIRRGTLNCIIEGGIKFVMLQSDKQESHTQPSTDDKYYNYIEEENQRLKDKISKLEGETKNLREQKEIMLLEERNKIERIYKERDEQLKNVLNVVANKFLAHIESDTILPHDSQTTEIKIIEEAEVVEKKEKITKRVSLKKLLKLKNYSDKKSTKIIKRFKKIASKDKRLTLEGKKVYLYPSKYDYTDLLK